MIYELQEHDGTAWVAMGQFPICIAAINAAKRHFHVMLEGRAVAAGVPS